MIVGIAVFVLLTLVVAAAIAYPLLPGKGPAETVPAETVPAITDADIVRAVRKLRRQRGQGGLSCPSCGQAYAAGDRFCVACGGTLPEAQVVESRQTCPACGEVLREGDLFCSKCGHRLVAEEGA